MSDFECGSSGALPTPGFADRMVAGDFDKVGDADIFYQTAVVRAARIDANLPTNVREYQL